ncbi:MAG: class I SAM-dependent methyltransferase [Spirochaetales bacterium]|nr:class I SAM-dependent methyltransferase [Spirochaetales bacterium]
MINKNDVIAFFDMCAPSWDADIKRDDMVINTILDNAGVRAGARVLDIACGTGVLIPDYINRGVKCVVGVDISPEMIKIASSKFKDKDVSFVCADAETTFFGKDFDCIVIYNAFPHFCDVERLLDNLCSMLKKGGILTVAHGMSRDKVNGHHKGGAASVSNGLVSAEDLALSFGKHLEVTTIISDERMYQVCGKK